MSDAATIARALRGYRSGDGYLCRCPVPSHGKGEGDRSPSLRLSDGEEKLLIYCFAGCDARTVLDELRRCNLLDDAAPRAAAPIISAQNEPHEPDRQALAIWRGSQPLAGTLGEIYLRDHRSRAGAYPPSLRFMPSLRHPKVRREFPALVAAVCAGPPDRRIVAVQATFLRSSDGGKAPLSEPRWSYGRLGKGAVRLAAAGDELGLAEGTEDALSAMALTGVPTWSCVGGKRMHLVEVPPAVRVLHIFADDDEPGRKAADRAAETHSAAGREVVIRLPPAGFKDWNDFEAEERRKAEARKAVAA